jgi:hypothetical protein
MADYRKSFNLTKAEAEKWLTDTARGFLPKMKASVFVMVGRVADEIDPFLALQVGAALLLDKPLIIVAIQNAWIPARLRGVAEAVIEGPSIDDPNVRRQLEKTIDAFLRKQQRKQ